MSTLSQFISQSSIKTIQRGTLTITGSGNVASGTISAVDITKTTLNHLGNTAGSSSTSATTKADLASMGIYISLISSTTVYVVRNNPGTGGLANTVSYEVIEYN
jgi:hypothetical protein